MYVHITQKVIYKKKLSFFVSELYHDGKQTIYLILSTIAAALMFIIEKIAKVQ